jgi:hypothetical protein
MELGVTHVLIVGVSADGDNPGLARRTARIGVMTEGYEIRTELAEMDFDRIHPWLSTDAYWAMGRTRDNIETAARHSLNFGVFDTDGQQVAYARVGFEPLPHPEWFMVRS